MWHSAPSHDRLPGRSRAGLLAVVGLLVGLSGAAAADAALANLLYGVNTINSIAFGSVTPIVAARWRALRAGGPPSGRRADPAVTLRAE